MSLTVCERRVRLPTAPKNAAKLPECTSAGSFVMPLKPVLPVSVQKSRFRTLGLQNLRELLRRPELELLLPLVEGVLEPLHRPVLEDNPRLAAIYGPKDKML